MSKYSQKIPFSKALLFIFLSVTCISFPAWSLWLVYCKFFDVRSLDPRYHITVLIQTSMESEALKTSYLAELLDLSTDKPKNLYQLNIKEEQEKLKSSPMIANAIVKKIFPNILYVDYSLRKPIAYLADVSNTLIDKEGMLFPFKPFYSPKKIPEIYLGESLIPEWGNKIENDKLQVAYQILDIGEKFFHNSLFISKVDVSEAFGENLGKNQIILVLKERDGNRNFYLRLPNIGFEKKIKEFKSLYALGGIKSNLEKVTIDLRLPHLIFMDS